MKHCERACCQEETRLPAAAAAGVSSRPVEGAPGYESYIYTLNCVLNISCVVLPVGKYCLDGVCLIICLFLQKHTLKE